MCVCFSVCQWGVREGEKIVCVCVFYVMGKERECECEW